MTPDYYEIDNPQVFLDYYLDSYETEYREEKVKKIASLFPMLKGKRVLEIGCGGGIYSLLAKEKGAQEITLLDISRTRVKGAEINLRRAYPCSLCNGIAADAVALPFVDEYFDFVLLIDVIEHVRLDDVFLNEVRRVSRRGGLIVVSTQNQNSLNFLVEAPLQRILMKNHNWMGWDDTHLRFYNSRQLYTKLKRSGLYPIMIKGTYFTPYLIAHSYISIVSQMLSKVVYKLLLVINRRIEKENSSITNLFGWSIIFLCQRKV